MIFVLDANQVLLNDLYEPCIKNGKPSIRKNQKAKEYSKYVKMMALSKRPKMITGDVLFHMDICIAKRKNYDIDASLKLILDAFQGIVYKDDIKIVDLWIRKHLNQEKDELIIKIEEI